MYKHARKENGLMDGMELQGERITLKPLDEANIPIFTKWVNDPEVLKFSLINPISPEDEVKWFHETVQKKTEIPFTIHINENNKPIGNCALHEIDNKEEVSCGIIIGEKDEWGKGYGTEAMSLLRDYARDVLRVRRIWLKVDTLNERAQHVYEKVGYTICEKVLNPNRVNSNGEEYIMEIRFE